MSYDSKIIEFQRLAKTLWRKIPKITGKKYRNETIYLDFVHHDKCEFRECELIINYGILGLTFCEFHGCKFTSEKDSPASNILKLDKSIRESISLDKMR